jgi:hypothetical protein
LALTDNHYLLKPHQQRALAITLREVEMTLRKAMADLTDDSQGILYRKKLTLSAEACAEVRHLILAALDEIARLAETFDLPVHLYDNSNMLRGGFAVLRSNLYDMRAEKLQRFGEVSPDSQTVLDPRLMTLITLLQDISQIAQR